ncbi:hypothetical protein HED60_11945 [Planctomycetales bacterium ZRK34]|nr:hypothetical protein HED60_11945 [Planctomycetales bacterium ZRK34]
MGLAVLSVLILAPLAVWMSVGAMTAVSSISHNGAASHGNDSHWFAPQRAAIIMTGPEAEPYAQALRDELIDRGWFKQIDMASPGQTVTGRVDFFFCVGEPELAKRDGSGVMWTHQVAVPISGGVAPLLSSNQYVDQLTPPRRRLRFSYQIRNRIEGYGMPVDPADQAQQVALELLDAHKRDLDPASTRRSADLPDDFFGVVGEADSSHELPVKLDALAGHDLHCIADGPGYMARRRMYWVTTSPKAPGDMLPVIARQLYADGWRLNLKPEHYREHDRHLRARRQMQLLEIFTPPKSEREQIPWSAAPADTLYIIAYTERFSGDQSAAVVEHLFELQRSVDELVVYENLMTRDQRRRLIPLLEAAPKQIAVWHCDMARRYHHVLDDTTRAHASLRKAYDLALAERDFKFIHQTMKWAAKSIKLPELAKPMTRRQLLDAGAVDLEAGPVQVKLAPGDRFVGFVTPGDDIHLFTIGHNHGNQLRYEAWRPRGSSSSTTTFSTHQANDALGAGQWLFTWTLINPGPPPTFEFKAAPRTP